MNRTYFIAATWLLSFLFSISSFASANTDWVEGKNAHSRARLVSQLQSLSPEVDRFFIGVEIELDGDWHTYWKNAGDVGLAPSFDWSFSGNWQVDELHFPAPRVFRTSGKVATTSYGYKDRVLYLAELSRPSDGTENFKADLELRYLVCEEICVPETASFELSLPQGSEAETSGFAEEIEEQFVNLPQETTDFVLQARDQNEFEIQFPNYPEIKEVILFSPDSKGNFWKTEKIQNTESLQKYRVELLEPIETGEFLISYESESGIESVTGRFEVPEIEVFAAGFWWALFFAFLGGAILNLMPCVLPVLVLKTNSLLHLREKSSKLGKSLGLTILGILISFVVLAAVTAGLKYSGQQVGWGFQFQSPVFVSIMAIIIFLFALNLFGIFEIELPSKWSTKLGGQSNAFFEGVFATLLATPCSAPFLGTALTYALTASYSTLFVFFVVMGLGLALPYLVLLLSPGLLKFLPRPGNWMNGLRRLLGYSLILAIFWLLYVVQQQTSVLFLFLIAGGLLGIWIVIREFPKTGRWAGSSILVALILWGATSFQAGDGAHKDFMEFDRTELSDRLESGETAFVTVTADWCLTCKFNESTVINTDWFDEILAEQEVQKITYDWTKRDDEIGAFLKEHGRVGIPFSALMSKEDTYVFPELLTEGNIQSGFDQFFKEPQSPPE